MAFRRSVVVGFVACLLLAAVFAAVAYRESSGPTREAFATNEYVLSNVRFTPSIQIGDTVWRKHEGLRVTGDTGEALHGQELRIRHDSNGLGYAECDSIEIPFDNIQAEFTFYIVLRRHDTKTFLLQRDLDSNRTHMLWLHGPHCYFHPFLGEYQPFHNSKNPVIIDARDHDLGFYDVVIVTYKRTDGEDGTTGSDHLRYTMRGYYENEKAYKRYIPTWAMNSAKTDVQIIDDIHGQFKNGKYRISPPGTHINLYECGVLPRYINDFEFDNIQWVLRRRYFDRHMPQHSSLGVAFDAKYRLIMYNRPEGSVCSIGDDARIHTVSPSGDSYETHFKYYGNTSSIVETSGEKLLGLLPRNPKFLKVDSDIGNSKAVSYTHLTLPTN